MVAAYRANVMVFCNSTNEIRSLNSQLGRRWITICLLYHLASTSMLIPVLTYDSVSYLKSSHDVVSWSIGEETEAAKRSVTISGFAASGNSKMHIAATKHRFWSISHHSMIEYEILFAMITSYSDFQRQ